MRPTSNRQTILDFNEKIKNWNGDNKNAQVNLVDGFKHVYTHFVTLYAQGNFEEMEGLCDGELLEKIKIERRLSEEWKKKKSQSEQDDLVVNQLMLPLNIVND